MLENFDPPEIWSWNYRPYAFSIPLYIIIGLIVFDACEFWFPGDLLTWWGIDLFSPPNPSYRIFGSRDRFIGPRIALGDRIPRDTAGGGGSVDFIRSEAGMLILVLVLVLKDSLRTFLKSLSWFWGVRSLSLSWSLGVRFLSLSWSLWVRSLSLSWSLWSSPCPCF